MTAMHFETAANTSLSVMESKAMTVALNQGVGDQRYRLWSKSESYLVVVAERTIGGIALSYAVTNESRLGYTTPCDRHTAMKMIAETMNRKMREPA